LFGFIPVVVVVVVVDNDDGDHDNDDIERLNVICAVGMRNML
jgi:hypothetical protein